MVKTFAELNVHPKDPGCAGCPLRHIGASFARTDGTGSNGVALVGEALGESEALAGRPFQGEAGMMLNRILHRGGLERKAFLITNTINCHPPNNYLDGAPYEAEAIAHCRRFLDQTLEENPQVRVLVPMGNTALEALTGYRGVKNFHGTVHWNDRYQRWVVPTLHPSFVLRTGCKEFPTVLFDIGVALAVVRAGGFERSATVYVETPSAAELRSFVESYERELARNPETILAADIETAWSSDLDEEDVLDKDQGWPPTRISFAFAANAAITVPFSQPFLASIQQALGGPGTKVFWNGNKFDVPKLKAAGCRFSGIILDAMDLWHFFRSDLPRGLGYVSPFFTDIGPWKHLSNERPEFYSCVDADALLRIVLKIKAALVKDGTWDVFLKYFAYLEPRFQRMSEVGIGIDETVRQERARHYENIRDNTAALIQDLIPDELKPRAKGSQGGYRGKPHDVRLYLVNNPGATDEKAWTELGYRLLEQADGALRWDKILDFNHNSAQQIIKYIEFKYGSGAVPRDKKTGRPTTGQEELARLARQHDDAVLNLILDAANADGKITAFIKPWTPAPDGRVHGIFTNNPATPRIASQGPNLQNFPIRSAEASELRRMIVPGEGFEYLIEVDYRGIEAIIVGILAKDPDYVRLAYRSIHSFVAAAAINQHIDLKCSDADLDVALKEAKKLSQKTPVGNTTMYDAAKRTVHGSNYREGALLLHRTFPEIFPTVKIAQQLQDLYFGLFPKIVEWQDSVVDWCYEHCFVENPWHVKRWLWAAKRWVLDRRTGDWMLKDGDDAKKAIATIPQGSAGMVMRGALVRPGWDALLDRACGMKI